MDLAITDKYKKFLNQKADGSQVSSGGSYTQLPFFNPNKHVEAGKQFAVRVIPNKDGMFFYEFKKHSFKIGTWKNAFCGYSVNENGERVSEKCPFCDFIEEYKGDLEKDIVYKLSPKDSYMILVFNYTNGEIQKYEVNHYGIIDIISALDSLGEDFDPDADGFDLLFAKDTSGYAKVCGARLPKITIAEIIKTDIPKLKNIAIPQNKESNNKYVNSLFNTAIAAFAPTYSATAESITEENNNSSSISNGVSSSDFDPNADESDIQVETQSRVVDPIDDATDDDIMELRNTLAKARNKV